jgi:acyl-CoA thioesterase
VTQSDPKIVEALRARSQRNNLLRELNMDVVSASAGRVTIALTPPANSLNGRGFVHGGFLFSICDTACAFALLSHMEGGVTQSAHITYIAPGKENEKLTIAAEMVAKTKRTQTYDARITNPAGDTVAIFRGIFQLMPPTNKGG